MSGQERLRGERTTERAQHVSDGIEQIENDDDDRHLHVIPATVPTDGDRRDYCSALPTMEIER